MKRRIFAATAHQQITVIFVPISAVTPVGEGISQF